MRSLARATLKNLEVQPKTNTQKMQVSLLSKNWEKYVFHWEKLNFEHIGNSVHTEEFLALGKALHIYINYLMFYASRQHVKSKHSFKYESLH